MKNSLQTLIFAAVLGITCSTLLVTASLFTAPYQKANQKAEQIRNYLAALDAPVPENASAAELIAIFDRTIRPIERNGLECFEYRPEGATAPQAVAVAFAGPGVWGPIEGVMALEPDMLTIRGIRFFKQEETPGLGSEINAEFFLNRFKAKQIIAADGTPGFHIRKPGEAKGSNEVDGITAATMTSDRVGMMLDTLAKRIRED